MPVNQVKAPCCKTLRSWLERELLHMYVEAHGTEVSPGRSHPTPISIPLDFKGRQDVTSNSQLEKILKTPSNVSEMNHLRKLSVGHHCC